MLLIDLHHEKASLGAYALRAQTREQLENALIEAREHDRTSVVVVETDHNQRVVGYESWWDVPIAETSELESVTAAYQNYAEAKKKEKLFF
jgi:3D-(3,5/4)-trihydroxycyclohexane-1,2-dione acylhydrolase (decyclizing)